MTISLFETFIKGILEKQLHLTVADRPEDAEHVMIFRWSSGGNLWFGRAFVAKRISPERLRILSSYRASEAELDDLADEYAKGRRKITPAWAE